MSDTKQTRQHDSQSDGGQGEEVQTAQAERIEHAETLGGPERSSIEKDPKDWVTGDEPATGAQKSYIDTLARQAGEEIPADLTKAQASETIERLQDETGRHSG